MATVTKAAAISSAMLARKQSYKGLDAFTSDHVGDSEKEAADIITQPLNCILMSRKSSEIYFKIMHKIAMMMQFFILRIVCSKISMPAFDVFIFLIDTIRSSYNNHASKFLIFVEIVHENQANLRKQFGRQDQSATEARHSGNLLNAFAFQSLFQNLHCVNSLRWYDKRTSKILIITACLLSLISVSLNTPTTLDAFAHLQLITFVIDVFATIIFTAEAAIKMKYRGILKENNSYLRDRWGQFDFFMLICHWISVVTQKSICLLMQYLRIIFIESKVIELLLYFLPNLFPNAEHIRLLGLLRAPRPLIMLRLIRSLLKIQLPRNRISQIFKRSSQQVYNVTIFFLFFMSLYAILGVQLFGRMDYHCVKNGTDPKNVSIRDLAIPDTYCSPDTTGYQCPKGMECIRLKLTDSIEGYYGMFNDFAHSVFSVYMAASQEGWVYVMYDCIDSFPSWKTFLYFTTLIFFLAWLVKNVFIAVITETFAEIRVQFSQMWGNREMMTEVEIRQVLQFPAAILEKKEESWRLIAMDAKQSKGWAPKICQDFYSSTVFQITIMILVLSNAFIHASFVHRHDGTDWFRKEIYYYIECGFTLIFNLECLFKVWCLSWKGYISRGLHKFEFILCVGSTLNIIKPLYDKNVFTYCQVFRVLRLIKASPMLEDFVYKIFGPGKKLGGIILFTISLLLLTSSISLQLFCFVNNLDMFRTLPQAIMSMFQIMTQEEWIEVVVETMRAVGDTLAPLVAIYFVTYHLLVTLIVLSLFVAVILDNLEMDEELKKVKQLKAREHTTSSRNKLPLRLRVFTHFPDRPQMVTVKRIPNEFPLPKIRDSFTRQYANDDQEELEDEREKSRTYNYRVPNDGLKKLRARKQTKIRQIGHLSAITGVTYVLNDSNKTRLMLSDSFGILPTSNLISNRKPSSFESRNRKHAKPPGGTKIKQIYQHLKENGDLFSPDDLSEKKEKSQGEIDIKAIQQKKRQAEMARSRLEEEMKENHPYFDKPLFVLNREHKIRKICQLIVYSKYMPTKTDPITQKPVLRKHQEIHELFGMMTYLDWTMFFLTCVSCISMLFEKPWPLDGRHLIMNNGYLQIAEYLFVIGMTFELLLKILANGLFFTPKAVIRDAGGVLTAFIYITSLIFLIWMPKHVQPNSGAQLFMIFRAMRPLRIYTLVPHIRRVVVELFKGFREILLVTILLVVLMFIFASYGVQMAGGKLAKCNDLTIKTKEECVGYFYQYVHVTKLKITGQGDPDLHPKANPRNFNFDHIGNAMLALFEILSFKGWTVMRDVILDRLGAWAAIFVHIYVFIGCMIGLTLFVGVVIANYSENRGFRCDIFLKGTALLTVDQRRWNDLKSRLKMAQPLYVPPRPPESSKIRKFLYDLSMSQYFKRFFTICVLLNSMLLFVPWSVEEEEHPETKETLKALIALSAVFTLLFAVEIICKVIAFTHRGFWQSVRNRIDLVITLFGLIWCLLHFFVALPTEKKNLREVTYLIGYSIVVMRFFTIVGRHSTLKMLMLTVFMSMLRSFFIIMAMFLLMLFYAYAGVILFGMVKYGQAVNRHANFRSSSNALAVLFRIVTGEDWNEVMHDCMRSPPYCWYFEGAAYWETDCGNYHGAIIYFCSFYLTITYIVLNLLVAIIMENFSLFYSSEEDALLSYADIRNFQTVWNIVDKEQKGYVVVRRVKFLLRLLKGRLEVDPEKDRLLFKHMCYEMEQLHNSDEVSFHDVLSMLSYRSVDIRKHLQLEELVQREELEYLIEEEVAKLTIRSWLEKCLRRMRQKEQNFSFINSLRAATAGLVEPIEVPAVVEINKADVPKKSVGSKLSQRSSLGNAIADTAKKLIPTAKSPFERGNGRSSSIKIRPKPLTGVAESIEDLKKETADLQMSPLHSNILNSTSSHSAAVLESEVYFETIDVKEWWNDAIRCG
ncbi:transporter, cation channel family [Trichinella spiralis]|uniref:transporter, cation channel family n=1 Tax=Trichinella spiralis TaxID=6334 RepID=UPI0001EFC4CC|nr:transporter, cation channel family [Trichinella spiralis]